jgi:hypothetical protein
MLDEQWNLIQLADILSNAGQRIARENLCDEDELDEIVEAHSDLCAAIRRIVPARGET